jgi:hypothetical protein
MLWTDVDIRKSGRRLAGGALIIFAALTAAHAPAFAQQKTPLRVAYIPVITWLPALVAKEMRASSIRTASTSPSPNSPTS